MARTARVAGYVLLGLLAGIALLLLVFLFLTRTQPGIEQVRRIVIGQLEDRIEGELRIGRVAPGRLLAGVTVYDLAIDDPLGRPFLRVDSARLAYDWRTLLAGDFVFSRVAVHNAVVNFERLPDEEEWNFQRIFPEPVEPPERRLILFEQARIFNGTFVIRTPLELEPPVQPEDTARLIIEPTPRGPVRVLRFEDVDADLPTVLWETPDEPGQMFQIASLSTLGYIWEDPFDLRDLRGAVTRRDSIVTFEAEAFRLPDTHGSAIGQVVAGEERTLVDIRIEGDAVAFEDLQWLYPPLPDEGGGTLTFHIRSQPVGTLWLATDARLRAPGTHVAGSFGIVTGDTLYFTNVSLRASPLDVALLEEVLPVDLPVEGLLVGTVILEGPLSRLNVRGDVNLVASSPAVGLAAGRWHASLHVRPGLERGGTVEIRNLTADIERLDLVLASALAGGPELVGAVSGRVEAAGRLDRELSFAGALQHDLPGHAASRIEAAGRWRRVAPPPGEPGPGDHHVDIRFHALPLELDAVAAMVPGLDRFHGSITGPIHVEGTPRDLMVDAALETVAGRLSVHGRVDVAAPAPRYELDGVLAGFMLDEIVAGLPATELVGGFQIRGVGLTAEESEAEARVDLRSVRIEGLEFTEARAAVTVAAGLARLDGFVLAGRPARLEAAGTIGLVGDRVAALTFHLASDSVGTLRDALLGDALPQVQVPDAPPPYAGRIRIDGDVTGSLASPAIRGEGSGLGLAWAPIRVDTAAVRFAAEHVGTDTAAFRVAAEAEGVTLYDRVFDRATLDAGYAGLHPAMEAEGIVSSARGAGNVRLDARSPADEVYRFAGAFRRNGAALELDLREVFLDAAVAPWTLVWPARVHLADGRLVVDSLGLGRADGRGRVRARGVLPFRADAELDEAARAPIDFALDLQGVSVSDLLRVLRPELDGDGLMDARLTIRGTAGAPILDADLGITSFRHHDVRLERVDARLAYGDRRLDAQLSAGRDGRRVLSGDGEIPLDLAFTPVAERRLAEPMIFELRVDSLPAVLVTALLDGFSRVEGHLDGLLAIGGTTLNPSVGGTLELRRAAATWAPLGVRYRDVEGTFRFVGDGVVAVDAAGRADAGRAAVTGTVAFDRGGLADPGFDLLLAATEFQAARRRDVDVVASGEARLRGSYTAPLIDAALRVDRGTLNLDEVWRQYQIIELERPFIFGLVDTADVEVRGIVPTSEFLRNMVIQANVAVGRDSWLRSREMNVEVSGDLVVEFDRTRDDLRLTGALHAVRGSYVLYGRRFAVRQGVVEFVGTPGVDPNLDIVAAYRGRDVHGDPLDIHAQVSGTLQNPRVAMSSDVQPPISESDLISYLLFGRPTYALAAPESRALDRIAGLGVGFVGPAFWGYAASGLEIFAQSVGLDYLAITAAEAAAPAGAASAWGLGGFLAPTQVEVGRYLPEISPDLFLAISQRIAPGGYGRGASARLEWRFHPTWTAELFVEDRFARTPSFGFDQSFELRKVYGFFLFREWGFREWRARARDPAAEAPTAAAEDGDDPGAAPDDDAAPDRP